MKARLYRLLTPFMILQGIILIGISGYMFFERYSFVEAVYMTTLAITTVGFGEVRPLSENGQIFTVILLIFSWSTLAFVLARITQFVVTGEINEFFKIRKIMGTIAKQQNHVIVCGFGRNGEQAALTLKSHSVPFVVIEKEQDKIAKFIEENFEILYIVGDATLDETLIKASVKTARALITALPTDADNVFIVLSARSLKPEIQIISRASDANSLPKLKKAGADNVILPDKIGGTHMATLVSKPDVIEFIDFVSGEEGETINMESISFDSLPAEIKNKSLDEVMNWKRTGVTCIGIKNAEGKFIINPGGTTLIKEGMKVIVLGDHQQIQIMKKNLTD